MRFAAVVLVIIAALAGCVDGDDAGPGGNTTDGGTTPPPGGNQTTPPGPTPSPNQTVELAVRTVGQYPVNPAFEPAGLSAPAGAQVHVTLTHADTFPGPIVQHDWILEGVAGAETALVSAGESADVTFSAPGAGTYGYYCSVGDHRQRGMEGTFTVT